MSTFERLALASCNSVASSFLKTRSDLKSIETWFENFFSNCSSREAASVEYSSSFGILAHAG
jgi:hypothetical protein